MFIVHFRRFGLEFDYPEGWTVDVDEADDSGAAVTVSAPGGGFWSVSGHAADAPADELAEAVLRQMREEYRDLDAEPADDEVGGRALPGYDLNFYCLDLTNTAQIRTLATPAAVYVLFCQAEDRDWERIAPVFAAMTASFVGGLPREDDDAPTA